MRSLMQTLEHRRLLATATWDGGGDNQTWTQAANWEGDVLPTAADDVVLPAAPATTQYITLPTDAHFRSLTTSRNLRMPYGFGIPTLTIDNEFRIKTGGRFTPAGDVGGTGNLVVEAGALFEVERTFGSNSTGLALYLPTMNYGSVRSNGGPLGPNFQNFGQLWLGPSDIYGQIINEVGGSIKTFSFGMSPGGGSVRLGIDRDANNVVVPSPFVNRGRIEAGPSDGWSGLSPEIDSFSYPSITVYLDQTATLGGSWGGSQANIIFARHNASSNPPVVEFDSTFSFTNGTLNLIGVDAAVRGMAPETGLRVLNGGRATFTEPVTRLAFLRVAESTSVKLAEGSRVLNVKDIEVIASPDAFDLADGLLVHGNQPGYGRPWITETTPAAAPTYASSTRGSINGMPITIEPNGSRYGVGYTTGAGLASHYPTHTFRGESFDDNDFIFFTTLRGDANFDREVNFDDLLVVAQRYGQSTSRGYADGNFAGNVATTGTVDFDDLLLLAQNYAAPFVKSFSSPMGMPGREKRAKLDLL